MAGEAHRRFDDGTDSESSDANEDGFQGVDWKGLSHDRTLEREALEHLEHLDGLKDKVNAVAEKFGVGDRQEETILDRAPVNLERLGNPAEAWDSLLEAWHNITPKIFVKHFAALGAQGKQAEYLAALAMPIELPPNLNMENAIVPQVRRLYMLKYHDRQCKEPERGNLLDMFVHSKYETMFGLSTRFVFGFVYTGAYRLLRPDNFKDRLYILAALMDAPREAGVFETMLGRAIATQCWDRVVVTRWVEAISNIIFVVALVLCGTAVRGKVQPCLILVSILAVLGCRSLYRCLLETYWYLSMFWHDSEGKFSCNALMHAFAKYFTGFTIGIFFFEVSTTSLVLRAIWETQPGEPCDHEHPCYWYSHPVLIMMVVTFKCFLSALGLISIIGDAGIHVFPAFAAVISKESIRFTIFVMMCVLACLSGYYMFPIDENTSRTKSGHKYVQFVDFLSPGDNRTSWLEQHMQLEFYYPTLMMAMKVFRLAIMGDFDVYELEGVDGVLKTTGDSASVYGPGHDIVHNGTILGELDDGDPNPAFHFGIQVYFMSVAFVVNIMIFNVYVGLLSTVYENTLSMRSQILHEYRSILAFKDLLWEHCRWFDPFTALPQYIVHKCMAGSVRLMPGDDLYGCDSEDEYEHDDENKIDAFVLAYDTNTEAFATYKKFGTTNGELAEKRKDAVRKKKWMEGRTPGGMRA